MNPIEGPREPKIDNEKLSTWIELILFLGLYFAVKLAQGLGGLPANLFGIPYIGLSWFYFLLSLLIIWRYHRGNQLQSLGLLWPAIWPTLASGTLGGLLAFLADGVTTPVFEALFGRTQDLSSFANLRGNLSDYLWLVPVAWLFAGFGEEVFFRGWLMSRLRLLLGESRSKYGLAWGLQALVFGLAHSYQGPTGIASVAVYGLVYGGLVVRQQGGLWAAIWCHSLVDTIGLTAIYTGALNASIQ
ncbi:CPBP family intramembrane metalloprotease [candidate division KSB1 bacterium]|nr:CPBP family intramembrane metalloprotease [candidate division KSB1 bacterium]NIR72227.1 CPBP family intramembrane metalloprotease [candidate division KSB1 bacterium]NIS25035.1 CPBP family intramembrane metalloprotease [candidate division KSB1 bacterium]NIT73022.1 CPBP family intramembrane metalloprotease [candidate division KSB1 bacterium]NIU28207.1 CPBP family intramembrane metalloprotease [candidate division KSB1 bacterium]